MKDELIHVLITRSFAEQLTVEDAALLSAWRTKTAQNEAYYFDLLRVWQMTKVSHRYYIPDTNKLWNDLKIRIEAEPRNVKLISFVNGFALYKIAAVFVVTIGLGYSFYSSLKEQTLVKQTSSTLIVFYLPDSSVVWLNKNSKLSYPESFNHESRIVYLQGEAFFDVRKNPLQPFIIYAAGTTTKVLGTSFNLKAYDQDSQVSLTVVTGKVSFSTQQKNIALSPQETGVYDKRSQIISLQQSSKIDAKENWITTEKTLAKNEVYTNEKLHPGKYINNNFSVRTNIISQTVIEGQLENRAKVCTYSRINYKVVYVSSSNKVFEEHFVIEKELKPGEQIRYKQKLPDWFVDTKEVKMFLE